MMDGTFTVTLTAKNDNNGNGYFQDTCTFDRIDSGLLINGDFENGSQGWIQGVDDNASSTSCYRRWQFIL